METGQDQTVRASLPSLVPQCESAAIVPHVTILRLCGRGNCRSSATNAVPQLRTTWEQKMQKKREKQAMQELQKQMRDKRNELLERQRLERENKRKQKAMNREKSVVVQVVKNPMKLKKLKRSQLRTIRKGADPNAPPVQQV